MSDHTEQRRIRGFSAFTLLEVLVAISVISLLMVMLLPALGMAKKNFRQTSCVNNVRSINTGMIVHADDFNGYFVGQTERGDDSLAYLFSDGYLSDPRITVCPNTENRVEFGVINASSGMGRPYNPWQDLEYAARHAHDNTGGHSYETFHHFNEGQFPHVTFDAPRLIKRDDVVPPWQTFIVLDSDNDPSNGGYVDGMYGYNNLPDEATNNHGKQGLCTAFLDGSARFVVSEDWIEVNMFSAHLDGYSTDMIRAKQLFEPRLQWGLRTDTTGQSVNGTPRGLRYWLE